MSVPRGSRLWAALFGLALALGGSAPSRAEPSSTTEEPVLPARTERTSGYPPYVPERGLDGDTIRAWCDEGLDLGRARAGTLAGVDLLLSVGCALERALGDRETARGVFAEAARAASPGASARGLAWLEAARLRLASGDAAGCREALRELHAALQHGPARAPALAEDLRWEVLDARVEALLPGLEAKLAAAEGDLGKAAARLEAWAEAPPRSTDAAVVWERAARLRARAGDIDRARDDIDRALAATRSERQRADWAFWRVHLLHGLLDEDGAVRLTSTWPGDGFATDVQGCLRGLEGNPHAGPWLLTIASTAFRSRVFDVSLDLYMLALGNRALLDHARGRPLVWRGLLAAFPVALELERFEDAERILTAVGRIGTLPDEERDAYVVALATAKEEAERRSEGQGEGGTPAPVGPETSEEPAPSPYRGRLRPEVETGDAPTPPQATPPQATPEPPGAGQRSFDRALAVAVTCLALLLLVFVARAVRKRRHAP